MGGNPVVFGRYEIIRRLAMGGMGEIFLARQRGAAGFDRLVILKSLLSSLASDPQMLAQFLDEARIVANVNHPNVVGIYEVGEWEGLYFIAMEYIDGLELTQLLERAPAQITPRVAATIIRDAASGLDSAHNARNYAGELLNIVHRDISPRNIMVRKDGVAKVVDFGLAVSQDRGARTATGVIKGTLGYMCPEQFTQELMTPRSDEYALGVVLWEMLTKRRLFDSTNPAQVLMMILEDPIPRPSEIGIALPKALDDTVMRMLSRSPEARFPTLGEVADALKGVVDGLAGRNDEVSQVVLTAGGTELAERTRTLTPVPVQLNTVVGTMPCPRCGHQELRTSAFCSACASPMATRSTSKIAKGSGQISDTGPMARPGSSGAFRPSPTVPTPTPTPTPPAPVPETPSPAAKGLGMDMDLLGEMPELELDRDGRGGGRHAPLVAEPVVLCATITGPDPVRAAACEAAGRVVAYHGGKAMADATALVAWFGLATPAIADGERAVRCAIDVANIVSDTMARVGGSVVAKIAVASGPVAAEDAAAGGSSKAPPLERARMMLRTAAAGRVVVTQPVQRACARRVLFEDDSVAMLDEWGTPFSVFTVSGVGTPAPKLRLAGRDAIIGDLRGLVARAVRRIPGTVVLVGEPGVGKSALLQEAEALARWQGLLVAHATAGRTSSGAACDVIRQLVESLGNEASRRLGEPDGEHGWAQGLIALGLEPADQARLRALVGTEPGDATVPFVKRRGLLKDALVSLFESAIDKVGVVAIVDDAHKADPTSLELLAHVQGRVDHGRFAVVAAGRPNIPQKAFRATPRTPVGPLQVQDFPPVLAPVADEAAVSPALVQTIHRRVAGNPLLAQLVLRGHIVHGTLERGPTGWQPRSDISKLPPLSIGEAVVASMSSLSPAALAMLRLGALWGRQFPTDLPALDGVEAAELVTPVQELQACGLVTTLDDQRTLLFHSAAIREAVLTAPIRPTPPRTGQRTDLRFDVSDARRCNLRVADALAADPTATTTMRLELVAHHYFLAEARDKSIHYGDLAAQAYALMGAPDAAAELWRRVLNLCARPASGKAFTPPELERLLAIAARTTEAVAEIDPVGAVELLPTLMRGVPTSAAPVAFARAERQRALVLLRDGKLSAAEQAIDAALDSKPAEVEPELTASLLSDLATVLEQKGDIPGAIAQVMQCFRIAGGRLSADPAFYATHIVRLGRFQIRTGDRAAARDLLENGVRQALAAGDPWVEADAHAALAQLSTQEGKVSQALEHIDAAAAAARHGGDRQTAARLLLQSAVLLVQLSRHDEGVERVRIAHTLARQAGWDEGVASAAGLLRSFAPEGSLAPQHV